MAEKKLASKNTFFAALNSSIRGLAYETRIAQGDERKAFPKNDGVDLAAERREAISGTIACNGMCPNCTFSR